MDFMSCKGAVRDMLRDAVQCCKPADLHMNIVMMLHEKQVGQETEQ